MLLLAPVTAAAHAILEQSQPPRSGSVAAGKVDIVLTYNSRIDQTRSRLTLIDTARQETVLHLSADEPANVLAATVSLTTPGVYIVRWQVLAIDGHITRGDVPFEVMGR